MRAIRMHQHGPIDVLKVDSLPDPRPGMGEVLVAVKTSALNHLDLWVRNGIPGVPLPLIMGSDAAGVVAEVGAEAGTFKIGDEVIIAPMRYCGTCPACRSGKENLCHHFHIPGELTQGLQAEYVSVPAHYVYPKPQNLDWKQAAALPLAALTAYHMLFARGKLQSGQTVLIYGASSGVGSAAIQMAKAAGARVITTAGTVQKTALAKKLGADAVIDYKNQPIGNSVREWTDGMGVDLVMEHTGAKTWLDSLRALKHGGTIVTCGATTGPRVQIDLRALFIHQQSILGSTMGTAADLQALLQLAAEGKLLPVIDSVFPMEQIAKAHQRLESGAQLGKIVVEITKD